MFMVRVTITHLKDSFSGFIPCYNASPNFPEE